MTGFSEPRADHGSWEYEPASGRTRWSLALYKIHGVSPADFEPGAESVRLLLHREDVETYTGIFREALASQAPFACQHRIVRPDGDVRTMLVRGAFMQGEDGLPDRFVGTTQDVTGRQEASERLWYLANHDSLSGLFNRRRFIEELGREIAFAKRSGETGAVLMLDLDRFKDVNDSLGHMAGDSLLIRVAEQLRRRVRSTDTLARLGGDEFALVLPGCTVEHAERIAGDVLEALQLHAGVEIAGLERRVTGSIGVATFGPGHDRTPDELVVEADLAMYRAKAGGQGGVEVYDEEMRAELAARMGMEGELREAIRRQELRVHYQPIISLADGIAIGCEALVRWEHPLRGMVGPVEFIGVAEEAGLISPIGEFVLERACRQAADWRHLGRHIYVSVNVSPLQIVQSDMVGIVSGALERSGLPAPLLCLEMTETSLLDDASPLVKGLGELKKLGVRIAIDDFGGGAASLGLLRLLPIDLIKIDRMFVDGIADHPDDRAIVAAVISLADELGLSVIAEGVETERQQGELRELGCECAQGFLYSPARYPEELDLDGYSATVLPASATRP